jgi:hypothetical protein
MFDFDVVTGPTPAELAAMRRAEKTASAARPADAARRPAEPAAPARDDAAQSTSR